MHIVINKNRFRNFSNENQRLMMTEREILHLLALQSAPNIGDITAKKLLQHCGTAENIFKEKHQLLTKINGIGTIITQSLQQKDLLQKAEKELKFILDNNINYWHYNSEEYPYQLKHCPDGPILLFHSGNINLKKQHIISIVGTRKMSRYGKIFCEQLIESLSLFNPVIVSGLAYGVDITAHKAALNHNLQTIACLAHGLDQIYPKTHKQYIDAIERNGGLITDFWSQIGPERENFLKRNRIVAGISEATIVIESGAKGGSLVTASIANSYNRDVFAVPGRTNDTQSIGCNNLIKHQQAHLLTEAADLIYLLNWNRSAQPKTKKFQQSLFPELSNKEQKIVTLLKNNEKTHIDALSLQSNIPIYQLSPLLLQLEMKGILQPHPGKYFELL